MGAINFYRRHLKHAADVPAPFNNLSKDSNKNNKRPVPLLAHPIPVAKFRITCDATSTALGQYSSRKRIS